jgi:NADH-quinone oxidoreductase subunit C
VTDVAPVTRTVPVEQWVPAVSAALEDGFGWFDWLSGIDEGEGRLAVVVHLWNPGQCAHLFLRTTVSAATPRLDTLAFLIAGAGWHEREAAEMFGLEFVGAPDRRPLLLPDGFDGHPLRKDFPLAARGSKTWPGTHEPAEHGPAARPAGRRRPTAPGLPSAEWPEPAATETAAPEGRTS